LSLLLSAEDSTATAGTVALRCCSSLVYLRWCISAFTGCFVSGLSLEGADWDTENSCLTKSKPGVLVVELPILKIIPIEAHRLKLQVPFHWGQG